MHPASTAAQMPTILNPGPIVTIPHGMSMMQMPSFATPTTLQDTMTSQALHPIMAPHPMQSVQMTSSPQSMSPHHSPPPPSYSPPNQPASPPRTYPGSPSYPQTTHIHHHHHPVMMDELGSPNHKSPEHYLHHSIDNYDRSPSRSPIQHRYGSPHAVHSPQALYTAPSGSPPMRL